MSRVLLHRRVFPKSIHGAHLKRNARQSMICNQHNRQKQCTYIEKDAAMKILDFSTGELVVAWLSANGYPCKEFGTEVIVSSSVLAHCKFRVLSREAISISLLLVRGLTKKRIKDARYRIVIKIDGVLRRIEDYTSKGARTIFKQNQSTMTPYYERLMANCGIVR